MPTDTKTEVTLSEKEKFNKSLFTMLVVIAIQCRVTDTILGTIPFVKFLPQEEEVSLLSICLSNKKLKKLLSAKTDSIHKIEKIRNEFIKILQACGLDEEAQKQLNISRIQLETPIIHSYNRIGLFFEENNLFDRMLKVISSIRNDPEIKEIPEEIFFYAASFTVPFVLIQFLSKDSNGNLLNSNEHNASSPFTVPYDFRKKCNLLYCAINFENVLNVEYLTELFRLKDGPDQMDKHLFDAFENEKDEENKKFAEETNTQYKSPFLQNGQSVFKFQETIESIKSSLNGFETSAGKDNQKKLISNLIEKLDAISDKIKTDASISINAEMDRLHSDLEKAIKENKKSENENDNNNATEEEDSFDILIKEQIKKLKLLGEPQQSIYRHLATW